MKGKFAGMHSLEYNTPPIQPILLPIAHEQNGRKARLFEVGRTAGYVNCVQNSQNFLLSVTNSLCIVYVSKQVKE